MSYLRDYLDYASANEAPEMFHVLSGYFTLSCATGRRTWMRFADHFVFPNIYVMLVGGAGNGKSEALNRAKRVLHELGVEYSGSVETPEGMWRYMAGSPDAKPPVESPVARIQRGPTGALESVYPMAIIASEFINFIGTNPEGWVSALNDIFDCEDYKYRTKNMGTDVLKNPYLTLLGALTTEVSATLHKQNIIGTGLGRRTLFMFGERRWEDPNPWPVMTDFERDARVRVVAHLRQVEKTSGEFTLTPAAHQWWDAWYRENNLAVPKMLTNLKSWYGTKAARLMELAMLTSLSEGFDLKIDVPHLEVPLAYLSLLEADLPKVFGGVGRNELAAIAQRILEYVNVLPFPETKSSVKSKFFQECRPPTDFDDCVRYLTDSEQVKEIPVQIGSKPDALIAAPRVMAEHVVRTSSAAQLAAPGPALEWAKKFLSDLQAGLDASVNPRPPDSVPAVEELQA